MKEIPAEIRVLYDALLFQKAIPEKSPFSYRKWLRYYLDFCLKYHYEKVTYGKSFLFYKEIER